MTIGLRPEHIGSTVGGDISLSGRTVLVEPTGAQTHVVFELAGDQVTAVVDGEQLVKVNTPLPPPCITSVCMYSTGQAVWRFRRVSF